METEKLIGLTAEIVANFVANNRVATGDIASVVQQVHGALSGLGESQVEAPQEKVPVVSVRASVKPDYIVCMECGKKQKTLKRHLQTAHGMSPEQYRADYGLPREYPLTAPNYSARRGEMARSIGFGRKKSGEGASAAAAGAAAKRSPTTRGKKADAAGE